MSSKGFKNAERNDDNKLTFADPKINDNGFVKSALDIISHRPTAPFDIIKKS